MNYASPTFVSLARAFFLIFGLITIGGGVMGYVKAGSMASLIAGSISGVLLLVAAFLLAGNLKAGVALGLIVSLGLAGRFVPALLRGKMMPAAFMAPLAVIGVVLTVAMLLGPSGAH